MGWRKLQEGKGRGGELPSSVDTGAGAVNMWGRRPDGRGHCLAELPGGLWRSLKLSGYTVSGALT